jgi:hypothetical protein
MFHCYIYVAYYCKHTLNHHYKPFAQPKGSQQNQVFVEMPQPEKSLKRHPNRDVPGILAWEHYSGFRA